MNVSINYLMVYQDLSKLAELRLKETLS